MNIEPFKPGSLVKLKTRVVDGKDLLKDGIFLHQRSPEDPEYLWGTRIKYPADGPPLLYLKMETVPSPGWERDLTILYYFLLENQVWYLVNEPSEDIPIDEIFEKVTYGT